MGLRSAMVLASCLICNLGCAGTRSYSSESPLFQPQLGIRIASSAHSPDLLPTPREQQSRIEAGPMPLSLSSRLPSFELDRRVQIEKVSQPVLSFEQGNVLAFRISPVAMEEGLLSLEKRERNLSPTDSRFPKQLAKSFHEEVPSLWDKPFRTVAETLPNARIGVANPIGMADRFDPFEEERNFNAKKRTDRYWRKILRNSSEETDFGSNVADDMRAWREKPVNLLAAFMGNALVQDTPEGGQIVLGPALHDLSDSDRALDVVRVRYMFGPFEARAETKQVWLRYRVDIKDFSFFVRSSRDYFDSDQKFQVGAQARLSESSTLRIFGGTRVNSDSLTGFSPFPLDPREREDKLGFILYLDHRF